MFSKPVPDLDSKMDVLAQRISELAGQTDAVSLEKARNLLEQLSELVDPPWNGGIGNPRDSSGLRLQNAFAEKVETLQFDGACERLMAIDSKGNFRLMRLAEREFAGELKLIVDHPALHYSDCFAVSPNLKNFVFGSHGKLYLASLDESGQGTFKSWEDPGFKSKFCEIKFAHGNDRILAVARHDVYGGGRKGDYFSEIFEIGTGKVPRMENVTGHSSKYGDTISRICFSRDDRDLLFTEASSVMRMPARDVMLRLSLGASRLFDFPASGSSGSVIFSPTGEIMGRLEEKQLTLYFIPQHGAALRKVVSLENESDAFTFSPSGNYICLSDRENRIHVSRIERNNADLKVSHLKTVQGRSPFRKIAFSPDESHMAVAEENGDIALYALV